MTETDNNQIPPIIEEDAEDKDKIRRRRRWKVFGWSVIGIMSALIVANFLFHVDPGINQAAIIVLFVAYLIYVILRRR